MSLAVSLPVDLLLADTGSLRNAIGCKFTGKSMIGLYLLIEECHWLRLIQSGNDMEAVAYSSGTYLGLNV